jgi:exoribonuclease-2
VEQAHFGLGQPLYTRATSPLRRYLDLLTHQQLRSHLLGTEPVPREELGQRIAEASTASGTVRRTERAANQHWKLVYLRRHPDWTGEALVLALEERRAAVIIPEMALETKLRRTPEMALDATLRIAVQGVDLADQVARFKVLS